MKCGSMLDRLSEYLDGELSPELTREIETHMADCDCCSSFIRSLKASMDAVHQLERTDVPDDIRARVLEAARKACFGDDS